MSRSTKTPLRLAGAVLGVTALLLTGCAIDDEGEGTPIEDQELTVACGNQEDVCQAWTQAFQEETGIPTSYVRMASGETVARLEAGRANPEFDVWHGGPVDGYNVAGAEGLLAQYESPAASEIDPEYMDPEGYWGGIYVGVLGFCSNQSVLDTLGIDAPQTWDDLLNPDLRGQIMMAHPATSGTAFTALWTQVVLRGGEDEAMDWMAQMHSNVLQYTTSGSAPAQSAGRGEVAVGLVFSHDCVKLAEQGMTELVTTIPTDGTGWEIGGVAVIEGTTNLEAAQMYYDWALSAEAQEIGPQYQSYQLLTNENATPHELMVDIDEVNLVDYDFAEAAAAKEALTARFDEEISTAPRD